jgi:hypothetical protein
MTNDPDQILVGIPEISAWLKDRFGLDTQKTLLAPEITITIRADEAVMAHVGIILGADDLAAFPICQPPEPCGFSWEHTPDDGSRPVNCRCTYPIGHRGHYHVDVNVDLSTGGHPALRVPEA